MRIAVLGAAASALLGGTLAITPLTSVSSPLPPLGACGNGGSCGKVSSVLMPETPPPGPGSAQVGGPAKPAGNVKTPGTSQQPGTGTSAARAVPGASSTGTGAGGAPAAGVPPGGVPDVPGVNDMLLPNAGAVAGLTSIPADAQAVQSVWGTIVAVPTSLVGLAGGTVGVLTSASLALYYLEASGILPANLGNRFKPSNLGFPTSLTGLAPNNLSQSLTNLGLPSSLAGLSFPDALANVPGAAAAIPGARAALPAAAARIPGLAAALPHSPLQALRAATPGLPAGPRLPGPAALPHPRLPGPAAVLPHPHLPGPMAILRPHCIGPHLGPIGACIP